MTPAAEEEEEEEEEEVVVVVEVLSILAMVRQLRL
jgi:hypothetical protein